MKLARLEPGERLDAERGDVVVCVVADAGDDRVHATIEPVLADTPASARLVLACPDLGLAERERIETLPGRRDVTWVQTDPSGPLAAALAAVLARVAPADAVVLRCGWVVSEGWLDGLREAAYANDTTATASPLTPELLTVAPGNLPGSAGSVRRRSLRIRPRTQTTMESCFYVRRSALELIGGYSGDFSRRCLDWGLCHVVADDVLVEGPGGLSLEATSWHQHVEDPASPLRRATGIARRAVAGISVAIDARDLSGPITGTQVHLLELIGAVARTGKVRVTAVIPRDISDHARGVLQGVGGVQLRTVPADGSPLQLTVDLVHRPFQIATPADLAFLAQLSDRLVLTHQDLIGYHNPGYFRSPDAWDGYRRITQGALAVADRVLFMSDYALTDALAEDLIDPTRAAVVRLGVDHTVTANRMAPQAPRPMTGVPPDTELMLCLGADFRHKNRPFALRILSELQRRHHWSGRLLFAGKHIETGSSAAEERRLLSADPALAAAVCDLGPISEAEKAWLLERVRLIAYPTVHEGFGFVPFEAAEHAVPCLWAANTSLRELLPESAAGIVAWDAGASADRALALMRDQRARDANLSALRAAAEPLRWQTAAEQMIEQYHVACDGPPSPAARRERAAGLMQEGLTEDALRLVGPGGALPRDLVRPLLALATHPRVGAPIFRVLRGGYRASYRARRRDGRDGR